MERGVFRRAYGASGLHINQNWVTVTSSQHISPCAVAALRTSLAMKHIKTVAKGKRHVQQTRTSISQPVNSSSTILA